MSPIDINVVDKKLSLLKGRPIGANKIERIECVSVSAAGQDCFLVTKAQRGKAEHLLASSQSKVTAFFINQEEEFYNFYREHGPAKAFQTSVFFQMHNDSLDWLMGAVKPHRAYIQALANAQGYHASFVTHDESFQPRFLHLAFKIPHNGGLGAACYVRIDLKTDQSVMIVSWNARLEALNDTFTRGTNDSGLAQFKARFSSASGMHSSFDVVLNVLDDFCAALYDVRQYAWTKLIALERITGKGTLYSWFGDKNVDFRAFSTGDLETVHRCVTETTSAVVAAKFQLRATETVMSAHDQYCRYRAQWTSPTPASQCRDLAMKETLVAHQSRISCLVDNSLYTKERTRVQLDAINTNINQAIAERAGSSASSMMVLALVGLIFLPCGLMAQILSLDYFQIAEPAVQLDSNIHSMVLIFMLTVLATLFCCGVYVLASRLWQKYRQRNLTCPPESLA